MTRIAAKDPITVQDGDIMCMVREEDIEVIGTGFGAHYIDDAETMVKIYTDAIPCPGLADDRSTIRMFYNQGDVAYVLIPGGDV